MNNSKDSIQGSSSRNGLMQNSFSYTRHIRRRVPRHSDDQARGSFPSWLHRKLPASSRFVHTHGTIKGNPTVCSEARCPNRVECFSKGTATFLALGNTCTRQCGFCDINFSSTPSPPDPDEPERILHSVHSLNLSHVVITMVARDDLEDGGAGHIASILQTLREHRPRTTSEVLVSDLGGSSVALNSVLDAQPTIFNHNIETVRPLSRRTRHQATYDRSLGVLSYASGKTQWVKSGLMVGLGETEEQVRSTIKDLKNVGCRIVTIGQYLQPSHRRFRVREFVSPEKFKEYQSYGLSIGIPYMQCGPFVRSSYNAQSVIDEIRNQGTTD